MTKKDRKEDHHWEFLNNRFTVSLPIEITHMFEKAAFRYTIRTDSSCSLVSPFLENAHLQPCSDKSIFMIIVTRKAINYCKFSCMISFGEYYVYQ